MHQTGKRNNPNDRGGPLSLFFEFVELYGNFCGQNDQLTSIAKYSVVVADKKLLGICNLEKNLCGPFRISFPSTNLPKKFKWKQRKVVETNVFFNTFSEKKYYSMQKVSKIFPMVYSKAYQKNVCIFFGKFLVNTLGVPRNF